MRSVEVLRLKKGLSIDELADRVGIAPSALAEIEMSDFLDDLPLGLVRRIAVAIEVSIDMLIDDAHEPSRFGLWKELHAMLLTTPERQLSMREACEWSNWNETDLLRAARALSIRLEGTGCQLIETDGIGLKLEVSEDLSPHDRFDGSARSRADKERDTARGLWEVLQGSSISRRKARRRFRKDLDELLAQGVLEMVDGDYFPSMSLIEVLGLETAPPTTIRELRGTDPKELPQVPVD